MPRAARPNPVIREVSSRKSGSPHPAPPARPDRRAIILAAACDVFLDMGYGAATIDQVIARVGGSKRTVYSYFKGKEALFAAVVDEIVGEIVRPLPDIDAIKLGVRETLQVVAEQHMTVVLSERHAALMRLVAAEASRFPEIGRAYYEHGPARGHKKLETYFAEQHGLGTLDIADAAQASDFFWGMVLHHPTLRRLYDVVPPPRQAEVKSVCAAAVDAFLTLFGTGRTRQRRRS
jgi:AcrR family transcriptional regulator